MILVARIHHTQTGREKTGKNEKRHIMRTASHQNHAAHQQSYTDIHGREPSPHIKKQRIKPHRHTQKNSRIPPIDIHRLHHSHGPGIHPHTPIQRHPRSRKHEKNGSCQNKTEKINPIKMRTTMPCSLPHRTFVTLQLRRKPISRNKSE